MIKEKILEFIQNNINRFATHSFLIKGWTITILSALSILLKDNPDLKQKLIIGFLVLCFWGLDSYYLLLERKYRIHFNNILNDKRKSIDMDIAYLSKKVYYKECFFSFTMLMFYGSILLFLSILILLF